MTNSTSSIGGRINGAIQSAITSSISGALVGTLSCAAALLGQKIMQQAGDPVANFSFKDIVLPTLVGTSVLTAGLGLIAGLISGKMVTVKLT